MERNKGKKRKKKRKILFAAAAALLLLAVFELLVSRYALSVSYYEIFSERITESIRMVELADLHNSSFGKDNARLVEKIAAQEPDLILIAGDLLNSAKEDSLETARTLITQLCAIAPVYISLGNHELEYEETYGVDMAAAYEAAGEEAGFYACTVLNYEYADIEVNGQTIRIGGIYGYCLPEEFLETKEADEEECAFLSEMQDTDLYTILLCHMPVCWVQNGGLEAWDINCVLTGHTHGGQVIIPGIGGLWAPDMGWFPGVLSGTVTSEDGEKTLVYSRGLGSTEAVPRLNNIPEIVVIDLKQET